MSLSHLSFICVCTTRSITTWEFLVDQHCPAWTAPTCWERQQALHPREHLARVSATNALDADDAGLKCRPLVEHCLCFRSRSLLSAFLLLCLVLVEELTYLVPKHAPDNYHYRCVIRCLQSDLFIVKHYYILVNAARPMSADLYVLRLSFISSLFFLTIRQTLTKPAQRRPGKSICQRYIKLNLINSLRHFAILLLNFSGSKKFPG